MMLLLVRNTKSEIKWENILDLNVDNSWWKKQNIFFIFDAHFANDPIVPNTDL